MRRVTSTYLHVLVLLTRVVALDMDPCLGSLFAFSRKSSAFISHTATDISYTLFTAVERGVMRERGRELRGFANDDDDSCIRFASLRLFQYFMWATQSNRHG